MLTPSASAAAQVVTTMVADVGQGIPRWDGHPGDRPVALPAVLDGWACFWGSDGIHGVELWKLRDPDVLFADDFESGGLALWVTPGP